jgi:hypothetical protein
MFIKGGVTVVYFEIEEDGEINKFRLDHCGIGDKRF